MVAPGPMAYPCAGPWPQAGGQPGGGVRGRFGPGLCRRRRRHRRHHAVGERLQSGGQLRGVVDWGRGGNGTPRGRTGARPMIKGGKASPRSFDWKLAKRAVGLERKQPGFLRGADLASSSQKFLGLSGQVRPSEREIQLSPSTTKARAARAGLFVVVRTMVRSSSLICMTTLRADTLAIPPRGPGRRRRGAWRSAPRSQRRPGGRGRGARADRGR